MKKIMMGILSLLLILILITPAFGAISQFQAAEAAKPYQHDGELSYAYGPYTYEGRPYYYISFTTNDTQTGTLVVNGEDGTIVKDTDTIRKIVFTHFMLQDITSDSVASDISNLTESKKDEQEFGSIGQTMKRLLPYLKTEDEEKVKGLISSFSKLEADFQKMNQIDEETIKIEKDVVGGNKSYENAKKISDQYQKAIDIGNEFMDDFKNAVNQMNAFYDIFIDNSNYYRTNKNEWIEDKKEFNIEMEGTIDELEVLLSELTYLINTEATKSIEWDVESAESRISANETPGFSFFLTAAILGLAAIVVGKRYRK
ncbi:hypothetical protein MsAg5_05810 [Methanosarcinaceae archaeon Ag5]|uniref:Uncharacterized protein n=1 Tax=Methanolapillus africanus TaxID=3028297 RepID=A0AAE4MIC7_9EURY|nr:hypothetical protein [Methanosarcinaceae archaeon Ag5]